MMGSIAKALPQYLAKYIAEQRYEKYTSQEHAAWRYIMRQNRAFFSEHAVPIYVEGLKKTGIPIDRIPRISEMDECLSKFGWGAVPVTGFIPPAAFLEFQARGVLPIACDMRTVKHLAYTPAPDIVHEAAGHAPIIAEPTYAAYLRRYAKMANRAIQSREDIVVYEAIRYLSDIKENPDTTPVMVAEAEKRLKHAVQSVTHTSEATQVARMAWWTVEYGLVGPIDSPRIYGAGLLSSVGESRDCLLSGRVKRLPLTVQCVEQSYDITEPQPQLFVAPDLEYLEVVLEELENRMAFVLGGEEGLRRARLAQTVNTVALDSGLEIGGQLVEYVTESSGAVIFLKFAGPVQLAVGGTQLPSHGRERHPEGFSTPLGRWEKAKDCDLATLNDAALARLGLTVGRPGELRFVSGFTVKGELAGVQREQGKLVLLRWRNCRVEKAGKIYFDPAWGEFDLAVGERVVSVYGGPPDRANFGELAIGEATSSPGRTTPYTPWELELFKVYARVRELRCGQPSVAEVEALSREAELFPEEWLLALEVLELISQKLKKPVSAFPWGMWIEDNLRETAQTAAPPLGDLIRSGLDLVAVRD